MLLSIPLDILLQIFGNLDTIDVVRFGMVSPHPVTSVR